MFSERCSNTLKMRAVILTPLSERIVFMLDSSTLVLYIKIQWGYEVPSSCLLAQEGLLWAELNIHRTSLVHSWREEDPGRPAQLQEASNRDNSLRKIKLQV